MFARAHAESSTGFSGSRVYTLNPRQVQWFMRTHTESSTGSVVHAFAPLVCVCLHVCARAHAGTSHAYTHGFSGSRVYMLNPR